MKRLLLFAGLPAVGKSTISKRIGTESGATIVDVDDFKRTTVDPSVLAEQIDPPELRRAYYQKALDHVFRLLDSGVDTVIMDEVFHLRALRGQIENQCRSRGVDVQWIEVRCPYMVVERRLKSGTRDGHILSTDKALSMYRLFGDIFEAFPPDATNHIVINNDDDAAIETAVASILAGA